MTKITYPKTPDTPISHLPFSPCVSAGNLLFVSGQASVDVKGSIVRDTFAGEFQRSMVNLIAVLETAGTTLSRVVQTRCYVDDIEDLPEFNRLYAAMFSAPYPARTTIGQCFRGKLKFEIDCIAVVD
jgi:2-iminobutanoate/2-iminopropanoate deaminase